MIAFVAAVVVGCGPSRAGEAVLCEIAHNLAVAAALTERAAEEDAAGDKRGAQELASDARSRAEQSHDQLQAIASDEIRHGATWQALLEAYVHLGQAANALLPGFEGTYGMTGDQLALGYPPLKTAAAALPATCTAVDASPSGSG